jgi:hypothetical protein
MPDNNLPGRLMGAVAADQPECSSFFALRFSFFALFAVSLAVVSWLMVAYASYVTHDNISLHNLKSKAVARCTITPPFDTGFGVDSCASDHICHDGSMFTALDFSKYKTFKVVHGETITSSGVGDVDLLIATAQGSLIFTAKADSTFDSDNMQPAGTAGGPHRVFVSGSPWPIAVIYRDIHAVPEIDPVLLSHLRFGYTDCRQIDAFLDKDIATGISLEKGETARCNPATNCAVCKLVKTPRPGRFPKRHQWLEVNAYLSTDICNWHQHLHQHLAPTSAQLAIAT